MISLPRTFLLIVFSSLVLLMSAEAAKGAVAPLAAPTPKALHFGSHGKRVKALQWLMGGHNPSKLRDVKTYRGAVDGHFGRKTANAVWNMKYRLGYPLKFVNKTAGIELFNILLGRETRSIQWTAVGAKRQSEVRHAVQPSQVTRCQRRIEKVAYSQVGVHEWPWGSNRGPRISYPVGGVPSYQSSTGAYGAAWCASFSQWVLMRVGHGPIANRSAGVFYIRDWAWRRGLLRSRPEPGALVLYLWSQGHMGVVVKVTQAGFYTVEGNYSNSVAHVYHPFSRSAIAFVYLPGCSV